jgi:protein-disulfide isomerase
MKRILEPILNAATVLLLLGAVYGVSRPESQLRSSIRAWREDRQLAREVEQLWPVLTKGGNRLDAGSGPVTLVEFGDYECPACKAAHVTLGKFTSEHADVGIIYRHLPLTAIHPAAKGAARASICAAQQGRFRQLHHYFYEADEWKRSQDWVAAAQVAGVQDLNAFARCLGTRETDERVTSDSLLAATLRLSGTPAFVSRTGVAKGAQKDSVLLQLIDGSD